jgi:hypothetical protein
MDTRQLTNNEERKREAGQERPRTLRVKSKSLIDFNPLHSAISSDALQQNNPPSIHRGTVKPEFLGIFLCANGSKTKPLRVHFATAVILTSG